MFIVTEQSQPIMAPVSKGIKGSRNNIVIQGDTYKMQFESETELINTVAENYLNSDEEDLSSEYSQLGTYNEDRFEDIPVPVHFTEDDPYADAEELFEGIEEDEELYIFSGGSSPDGMTEEQNLKGRAVHDYFGHYMNHCDFSIEGEFTKWYNQKNDVPDGTEDLLFSEVVGQVALVHYLEDGFEDSDYEQRAVLIDDEVQNAVIDYFNEGPA